MQAGTYWKTESQLQWKRLKGWQRPGWIKLNPNTVLKISKKGNKILPCTNIGSGHQSEQINVTPHKEIEGSYLKYSSFALFSHKMQ